MEPNKILKHFVNNAAIALLCFLLILTAVVLYKNFEEFRNNKIKRQVDLSYARKMKEAETKPVTHQIGKSKEGIPILMYHHVGQIPANSDSIRQDLTVNPNIFEQQVSWLKSQGYESIALKQLIEPMEAAKNLPKKPVIFTFDDGYSDVFENAVPILKKYGYSGSFAIITGFVGSPDYASWDQIKAASSSGMEIISHTHNHFDGTSPKFSYEYILKNLKASKDLIKQKVGEETHILVYPFGHFTPIYIQAARAAGFNTGLTVRFGKFQWQDNPMEIPRIRVHGEEDLETFKMVLEER